MRHKIQGRRSWSYALWARYVAAGKTPVEVRRRLELARLEAPNGADAQVIAAADRKLAELGEPVTPAQDVPPVRSAAPAADRDRGDSAGLWWW